MLRTLVFAAALLTLAASPAGARELRGSETGPLIMSGTMVPPTQTRRVRAQANNKCVPVTVKRQPLSLLSLR